MNNPIFVTESFLPDLEQFTPYLSHIWQSKILTNQGQYHQSLERELADFLKVRHITLINNGMTALLCAIKALDLSGEVITTPFSFIATSHALLWNGLTPVFVDINPCTFNLDPTQIEKAITEKTTAILPVHCYGNPANVNAIQAIADRYHLKVLYDAAHAFGINNSQGSILNHGSLSILSFHATKTFNTFEGGAIISHDLNMKQKIDSLKNFGIISETEVTEVGINGKLNEISAAMGLLQLQYYEDNRAIRKRLHNYYSTALQTVEGIRLLALPEDIDHNYAYFPILVGKNFPLSRDALYERLKLANIYSRRYFYPLISNFSMYEHLPSALPEHLPIANQIAQEVLCLPIHAGLTECDLNRVIAVIKQIALC